MATGHDCDGCGAYFMTTGRSGRYCSPECRREYQRAWYAAHPGYWSPATERGAAANARKAQLPCAVRGCPEPRYVAPGGTARSRCPQHEADAARERYYAGGCDAARARYRARVERSGRTYTARPAGRHPRATMAPARGQGR